MAEYRKEKRTKSIRQNQAEYNLVLRIIDGNCYSKEIYVILKSCSNNGDSKAGRIIGVSISKCIM